MLVSVRCTHGSSYVDPPCNHGDMDILAERPFSSFATASCQSLVAKERGARHGDLLPPVSGRRSARFWHLEEGQVQCADHALHCILNVWPPQVDLNPLCSPKSTNTRHVWRPTPPGLPIPMDPHTFSEGNWDPQAYIDTCHRKHLDWRVLVDCR